MASGKCRVFANLLNQYINTQKKTQFHFKRYCSSNAFSEPTALRSKKKKSSTFAKDFVDSRLVRTIAGKGGNGCISFLQLFSNDKAGPDGGDGGNGGHVIFEACTSIQGVEHVQPILQGKNGENGYGKSCHGHSATHTVIKVPVGTVVKNDIGRVVGDLYEEGMMFVAARGGAGGKGNNFFATDLDPTPKVAELGAYGENLIYSIELSSMAHFGMLGFPNAGKSTLLQAITRANPKVAPYPFTTLKPHLGVVQFTDYEQITIADLPGIVEGSHRNRGLGISFLRHAERCLGLLILLDMSEAAPWVALDVLRNEVLCFSESLHKRPQILVANKMDVEGSEKNLEELKERLENADTEMIIPISAKHSQNLSSLLKEIRRLYDKQIVIRKLQMQKDEKILSDMSLGVANA